MLLCIVVLSFDDENLSMLLSLLSSSLCLVLHSNDDLEAVLGMTLEGVSVKITSSCIPSISYKLETNDIQKFVKLFIPLQLKNVAKGRKDMKMKQPNKKKNQNERKGKKGMLREKEQRPNQKKRNRKHKKKRKG